MRIHYPQKSKTLFWRKYRRGFLLVVLYFSLYYGGSIFFPNAWASVFHTLGAPIWEIRNFVTESFSGKLELLHSKQYLVEENRNFKLELSNLNSRLLSAETARAEYEKIINLETSRAKNIIVAPVLVRPPQAVYDSFVLGKGENDGVKNGDLVFFSDSIIIGEVIKVLGSSSEARLFSSPGNILKVIVQDRGEFSAIGKGGGTYEMKVPRDVVISVGDRLLHTGAELWLYGSVKSIEMSEQDFFKKVLFNAPVNFNELSFVIIKSNPND